MPLTKASQARIERFIDDFIRSEYVSNWQAEASSDFYNEPDRAERCYEAAKDGADGSTHAEVIADWRKAFSFWIRDRRMWNEPERFVTAVNTYFDELETWHDKNGTLHQVIG